MAGKLPTAIILTVSCVAILIDNGLSYKAAVYEHAVIFPAARVDMNRSEALEHMKKNLLVYTEQCSQASKQVFVHFYILTK